MRAGLRACTIASFLLPITVCICIWGQSGFCDFKRFISRVYCVGAQFICDFKRFILVTRSFQRFSGILSNDCNTSDHPCPIPCVSVQAHCRFQFRSTPPITVCESHYTATTPVRVNPKISTTRPILRTHDAHLGTLNPIFRTLYQVEITKTWLTPKFP